MFNIRDIIDNDIVNQAKMMLNHSNDNKYTLPSLELIKARRLCIRKIKSKINDINSKLKQYKVYSLDQSGLLTRWLYFNLSINQGLDYTVPFNRDIKYTPSVKHEIFNSIKDTITDNEKMEIAIKYAKILQEYSMEIYNKIILPLYENGTGILNKVNNKYPKMILYKNNDKYSIKWDTNNKNNDNNKDDITLDIASIFYYKMNALYEGKDEQEFLYYLFLMLEQYDRLGDKGYQAAVPYKVFSLLQIEMKVETEMFASPFNASIPSFYSANPIIESIFSSKGSIINNYMNIKEGSYESNPPFTEEFMLLNAYMIEYILNNSDMPLSFVIINPNWTDTPSYYLFRDSKYNVLNKKVIRLAANKHKYCSGLQHKYPMMYNSGVGSFVFILQNKAGSNKWPITKNLIADIVKHFK